MKTGTYTLFSHGAGPLREAWITFNNGIQLRVAMGAYGNIARSKGGLWSWYPFVSNYPGVALHVHWFNFTFSILYACWL